MPDSFLPTKLRLREKGALLDKISDATIERAGQLFERINTTLS